MDRKFTCEEQERRAPCQAGSAPLVQDGMALRWCLATSLICHWFALPLGSFTSSARVPCKSFASRAQEPLTLQGRCTHSLVWLFWTAVHSLNACCPDTRVSCKHRLGSTLNAAKREERLGLHSARRLHGTHIITHLAASFHEADATL